MISQYLQSIEGIQALGIVSLVICFLMFLVVVVRALRADKTYLKTMEDLPLDAHDHAPLSSDKVTQ